MEDLGSMSVTPNDMHLIIKITPIIFPTDHPMKGPKNTYIEYKTQLILSCEILIFTCCLIFLLIYTQKRALLNSYSRKKKDKLFERRFPMWFENNNTIQGKKQRRYFSSIDCVTFFFYFLTQHIG